MLFPSDEDKIAAWIKSIPRKHWKPSKYSVVCIKHFEESDLSDVSTDKEGNIQKFPRNRCLLKPSAVPRIFPGLPEYLSKPSTSTRVDPAVRREAQAKKVEEKQNQWLGKDIIESYCDFLNGIESLKIGLNSKWKLCTENNFVCVYVLNCVSIPKLDVSIRVVEDLRVQVCVKNQILSASQLLWILPEDKLQRWSQLQNLLDRYVDVENFDSDSVNLITELERMALWKRN